MRRRALVCAAADATVHGVRRALALFGNRTMLYHAMPCHAEARHSCHIYLEHALHRTH